MPPTGPSGVDGRFVSRVGLAIFPAFLMVALDVAVPAPITVLIVGISLVATSHRDGPHH